MPEMERNLLGVHGLVEWCIRATFLFTAVMDAEVSFFCWTDGDLALLTDEYADEWLPLDR
jgi:hypothetical protein